MPKRHLTASALLASVLGANPPTAVAAIAQQIKGAQQAEITGMQALVESL